MTVPDDKHPWFDRRMSIGNLISIIVLIVAVVAGYYAIEADRKLTDVRITLGENERVAIRIRIERIEAARDDLKDRLTRVEVNLENQTAILREVLAELKRR